MPPIRTESRQESTEHESRILLALHAIQKGQIKSIRAVARLFAVPESTLRNRAHGIQPEDIYNFDDSGFAMGLISAQKVVTRAEYYGQHSILQPGNRE